jgi:hypothetical protein
VNVIDSDQKEDWLILGEYANRVKIVPVCLICGVPSDTHLN